MKKKNSPDRQCGPLLVYTGHAVRPAECQQVFIPIQSFAANRRHRNCPSYKRNLYLGDLGPHPAPIKQVLPSH